MTGKPVSMEDDLIRKISGILGPVESPEILRGIGDDTALLRSPGTDKHLLLTTDSQREGVHFRWQWIDPVSVGYRLVVANVSDVGAKGGRPFAAVVAVGFPSGFNEETLMDVYRGVAEASREYGVPVVGGDLSRDAGGWNFVMTLLGVAPSGVFPARSSLAPDDSIYLIGRPGRARCGLLSLSKGGGACSGPALDAPREAFRRPRALLSLGQRLTGRPEVMAVIDSSDGLERSLRELAGASEVTIEVNRVPVWPGILPWAMLLEEYPEDLVWTGGEDYDFILGIRAGKEDSFERWVRQEISGSPEHLFRVGKARRRGPLDLVFCLAAGERVPPDGRGFDHTAP